MFEKILDCPVCEKRFHYEHEGTVFPELLTCPFCGNEGFYGDYSALLLCTNCRKKLKVPLDILYDEGLSCPQCGAAIQTEEPNEFGTEDGTTIAGVAGTASRRRMLQDGEFFDKFRIISFLGSGGMAEVYLAEHLLLKQQCALKLMRSGMDQDDPVFIKRFVREAKVTHQLNHPNIVRVFDAGSDFQTGCLFIAMEYVEGCTLHDMFQKELFSEDDMLAVLDSMASALEKLEEAKVVHRDIKPSNIMYTADGVYKLMDLGIAKSENNRQAGEVTLTVEQSTIGTPGYASPEQCSAAHSVDIRSDIYSLGVTIYHIASGVMPFDAETPVAVIVKMMQTEAEPLKNHRPDLSAGFLELVERMMKKDPAARPQNAAELRELIFRVVSGKKISSNKRHEVIKHKLSNVEWRKVLKKTGYILLLLLIAAVAAVHLIYVANYFFSNIYTSYGDFIGGLFGSRKKIANTRRGILKTVPPDFNTRFQQLHPLMRFPDQLGSVSAKLETNRQTRKSEYHFPVVRVGDIRKKQIIMYDFDTVPYGLLNKKIAPAIRNGMLNCDEIKNSQAALFRFRQGYFSNYSLSLNMKLSEIRNNAVFRMGALEFVVNYGELCGIYNNTYSIVTDFRIPADKWFNITVVMNKDARKVTIFSGECLLGEFLLPYEREYHENTLKFCSYWTGGNTKGAVDSIALIPEAIDVKLRQPLKYKPAEFSDETLPGLFQRRSLPLTADAENSGHTVYPDASPDVVKKVKRQTPVRDKKSVVWQPIKRQPRNNDTVTKAKPGVFTWERVQSVFLSQTVDESFEHSKENYRRYKKAVDKWKSALNAAASGVAPGVARSRETIILTALDVVKRWKKRLQYIERRNAAVKRAKGKSYDQDAGRELQREIREFTAVHRDWGYSGRELAFVKKITEMLQKRNIDPNIELTDSTYSYLSGPAFKFFAGCRLPEKEKLINALIAKYPDPETLKNFRNSITQKKITDYGVTEQMAAYIWESMFPAAGVKDYAIFPLTTLFADGAKPGAGHLKKAILAGNCKVTTLLLAFGVNPNVPDENGETALFHTYKVNSDIGSELRSLLFAAGADPEIVNNSGKKAADLIYMTHFMDAWKKNDLAGIEAGLQKGVDPDHILNDGTTLLTSAAARCRIDLMKLLLRYKASPTLQDKGRLTPLAACAMNFRRINSEESREKNISRAILLLLENGADLRANPRGYGGQPLNMLWYIISHFERRNELIPELLKYTGNFNDNHWRSIGYHVFSRRDNHISDKNKTLLAAEITDGVFRLFLPMICRNVCLTPEIARKAVRAERKNISFASRSNLPGGQSATYPLLYHVIAGQQAPAVVEEVLKSGADPDWKTPGGRSLAELAKDPKIVKLLKKYSRK